MKILIVKEGIRMKKKIFIKKFLAACLVLIIVPVLIIVSALFNFKATSYIDAINENARNEIQLYAETIFLYETDRKAIVLYKTKGNLIYEGILDKRTLYNETKYRNHIASTSGLINHPGEWTEVTSKLKYAIVEEESDIDNFDCEGYTPIKNVVKYSNKKSDNNVRYIYIIDNT